MEKSNETKKKVDPKVVVFGNEVGDGKDEECCKEDSFGRRFHYHHRHGSFTWGLFFILIGILFLLSNFGVLPPVVWSQVAHLWPILIILIGLDTLMGHSEVSEVISSFIGLFIFAAKLFFTALIGPAVSERHCPKPVSKTPRFRYGHMHSMQEDGPHS